MELKFREWNKNGKEMYSYDDKFTNTKVMDLYGREFVIVICKNCLEELLRKCEE
ncbi:TPA: hypothetical protein KRE80_001905 [Clostridioides difficile]|nr:hypothetical protein [Clostridioides difficile]